jgi:ectoine hydroxylase-related dioxygenase (phytanoyl-CoA dioxygenase family)
MFIGPEISCNPVNVIRLKPPERTLPPETEHAGVGRAPWHQDLVNYPIEAAGTDLLTVWVALTDATEEMGCLQVVPRSHKGGLETHCPPDTDDPIVRKAAGGGIPDALVNPGEGVPLPMRAGDVLFMHRLTKHASLSNVSDNFRWSFDLRYHPTHQFSGQPLKPSWVARSRAHPETELTDWTDWARMWGNARAHLSRTGEVPAYLRYSPDNPVCAPS